MNVLEVNNIDLLGKRFNGYDIMETLNQTDKFSVKQMVANKLSHNSNVINIFNNNYTSYIEWLLFYEQDKRLKVHSQLSLTSNFLKNSDEFQNADIVHYHHIHNLRLPLYSLIELTNKKSIISLHDPWLLTGGCVHPMKCKKWKDGCHNCETVKSVFTYSTINSHSLWKLKQKVFKDIDVDLIVSSQYMMDMVKTSPITKHIKNIHYIPFGIDLTKFKEQSKMEARKKFGINQKDIVLFFRAQNEFKGTNKIVEALSNIYLNHSITLLTCDQKNLVSKLKNKYNIVELGKIKDENTMIEAYNSCDIFLMPSSGESFGLMAIEAMACAKPIIIFDNSALPSVTFAPECGYLVEDDNANELGKAIKFLIENKDERMKRGNLGRKLAVENYDINTYNNKIIKLYEDMYRRKNNKIINNHPLNIDYDKEDIQYLIKKLNIISKKMGLNIFKHKVKPISNMTNYIDYADYQIQEVLKQFNAEIYKHCIVNENRKLNNEEMIKIKKGLYMINNNIKYFLQK
ncbi:MAG: glycosyltransferase [Bacilli bacterium]|nr:glycosyltransferase [Bacilli bacterium]MDD4808767.1 glycosyltransferase [Bacilli bacterium]